MHDLLPQAALDTVVEGAELTGVVTRMMLYHGAQVDLGTIYDGCACSTVSTFSGIGVSRTVVL
jgi:hypothetical protein